MLDWVLEDVALNVCGELWGGTVKMNILRCRLGESWLDSFSLDRDRCRNLLNTVSNQPYGLTGREFLDSLTFTQRDLNSYSQPSRTTLFSLGI